MNEIDNEQSDRFGMYHIWCYFPISLSLSLYLYLSLSPSLIDIKIFFRTKDFYDNRNGSSDTKLHQIDICHLVYRKYFQYFLLVFALWNVL